MELRLSRCILRPFQESDAESIAKHANNRKIWLNLRDGFPHPYTQEDAKGFIQMMQQRAREAFIIDVDGQAVGAIGVHPKSDVERISAELGYWLAEDYWNRGIMSEAVRAITDYALSELKLTRIFALPYEWNPASSRVLEKCGYTLEARLKKAVIKDGKIIDQFLWAKVK